MKIVGGAGGGGMGTSGASGGLFGVCSSQRARNSATNAAGSISSCWTSDLRQYVLKKFDSDGTCAVEEPTKKNCLRSSDRRILLDERRRNRPSQSGISQPTNSIGLCLSG